MECAVPQILTAFVEQFPSVVRNWGYANRLHPAPAGM